MELTKQNLIKYQGTFHETLDKLNHFYSDDSYVIIFELTNNSVSLRLKLYFAICESRIKIN